MEKIIIKHLSEKYSKSINLIEKMLKDALDRGYSLEESSKIISDFWDKNF
jgi:hypothetical protein